MPYICHLQVSSVNMNSIGISLAIIAFVELAKGTHNLIAISYDQGWLYYQLPNAMYKNVFHDVIF